MTKSTAGRPGCDSGKYRRVVDVGDVTVGTE